MIRRAASSLLLLLACSQTPPAADGSGGADGTEGSGDGSSTFTEPTTGEPPPEWTTDGPDLACDPWQQDCAAGEKCTHYNSMGESTDVDATKCVPIPADPVPSGGICTATGGFGAGDDDCGLGEFCYFLGGDDVGACMPLCGGTAESPECPEGTFCSRGLGGALWMCLPSCDPLAQDCLEGANCSPQSDGFVCALDTSGEAGQIFDPCSAANGCDPGLMCAPPTSAGDCAQAAEGCCLPMCAVNGSPCPEALECLELFDAGTHPELSMYGVCAAPV